MSSMLHLWIGAAMNNLTYEQFYFWIRGYLNSEFINEPGLNRLKESIDKTKILDIKTIQQNSINPPWNLICTNTKQD